MARKRNLIKKTSTLAVKNIPDFTVDQPVYAKIKFSCPWPAKITYLFGKWCDVHFFGTTER